MSQPNTVAPPSKLESLRRHVEKGEIIAQQGTMSEGLILMETGAVRLEVDGQVVGRMELEDSKPGFEFLGEVSALLRTPTKATAIAEKPCTLVLIPTHKLEDVFRAAPSLAVRLAQSLCKKLVAASEAALTRK